MQYRRTIDIYKTAEQGSLRNKQKQVQKKASNMPEKGWGYLVGWGTSRRSHLKKKGPFIVVSFGVSGYGRLATTRKRNPGGIKKKGIRL